MPELRARLLFVSSGDLLGSLKDLLARSGFQVVHCSSGLEAATSFARQPSELVVLAVEELADSGLEVIRLIRGESPTCFIVVTASAMGRRRISRALKLGADACLLEPFYPEELVAILTSALKRKRAWLEEKLEAEKEQALARLSTGVAHEINNPLATISGWIQMLLSEPELDSSAHKVLINIKEETDRLAGVVKDLNALAGHLLSNRVPTELNALLCEAAKQAGLDERIQMELSGEELTVAVDDALARQALVDLLTALSTGAAAGIKVSSSRRRGRAIVLVRSNFREGQAQKLKELLDPFRAFAEEGIGEALKFSRSRGILRSFGGQLRVITEQSGQVAIEIELPLADWKHGRSQFIQE